MEERASGGTHHLRRLRINRVTSKNHRIRTERIHQADDRARVARVIGFHTHRNKARPALENLRNGPQHRLTHREDASVGHRVGEVICGLVVNRVRIHVQVTSRTHDFRETLGCRLGDKQVCRGTRSHRRLHGVLPLHQKPLRLLPAGSALQLRGVNHPRGAFSKRLIKVKGHGCKGYCVGAGFGSSGNRGQVCAV